MDAPSIPVFVADATGGSVPSILLTPRAAAPSSRTGTIRRPRTGVKPSASSGSTLAFLLVIALLVGGAGIAALVFVGPHAAARPQPAPVTLTAATLASPASAIPAPPVVTPEPAGAAPPAPARPARKRGRPRAAPRTHARPVPHNPY